MVMHDWIKDVEEALWDTICAILGMDAESGEAAALIRYTRRDTTTVIPPRTTDVIYITVNPEQDTASTSWVSTTYENGNAVMLHRVPLTGILTCYGPSSDLYAEALWAGIWANTGPDSALDVLRRANLTPVPPLQRPVQAPEQEDGGWRKRSDVRVRLELLVRSERPFHAISAPPVLTIE